jgi:CDP-diacylglycerol---glycerol-3-phosphate 3-phosphatidyltransferase
VAYDQSALATPANGVTTARLLGTPVLLVLVLELGPSWLCVVAWAVLASSDGLDGWLARRQGTTRSGAFLDPLADKFLVLGALVALVALGKFSWLPVALIALREVVISLFRTRLARQGVSVPARPLAKVKTFVQDLAVGAALLPPLALHHHWVSVALLWIAVVLTLWTGAQYLLDGQRLAASGATSVGRSGSHKVA